MTYNWKFRNLNISGADTERHFICSSTKALKCLSYASGMRFKKAAYALPNSDNYKYKTEEDLTKAIQTSLKQNK